MQCVTMCVCMCTRFHVHISGCVEWKEFPALPLRRRKDFGGRDWVSGCRGVTLEAQRQKEQQV